MGQITFSLKDETVASLRKDFDAFLRVSLKLDPQFMTPSFEDFLRAKLLDNMMPLTETAVQRMLTGGQYAWAKRTLDKEFPDVVALMMNQAAEFGFSFAVRSEWTPEELTKQAKEWATALVTAANGDQSLIDPLASQIRSAAKDIQSLEEAMQTPAWRLQESLRQRVYEAKIACESSVGSTAREKLGELRGLLRLGISHGTFQKQEAQQIMEYLRLLKPEIFVEEPYDVFTKLAAWLRNFFTPPRQPQPQPRQRQTR
jgi:alkylhydroperoxidase/carboxymuconolactone decarboxylase family protein YurZ